MSDYDSRRTGNGLLDTGSTPVWSISEKSKKTADIPFIQGDSAVFMCWFYILKLLFKIIFVSFFVMDLSCIDTCIDSFTIHWTSFPFGGKIKSNTVYANEGKRGV